jgi:hypothetical protein
LEKNGKWLFVGSGDNTIKVRDVAAELPAARPR